MLEEAAHTTWVGNPWMLAGAGHHRGAVFGRLFVPLSGPDLPRPGARRLSAHPHDPGSGLWAAPALLALLVVMIGLAPMTTAGWLVEAATSAVTGDGGAGPYPALARAESPALWMSLLAIGGGPRCAGRYAALSRLWRRHARAPRPSASSMRIIEPLAQLARAHDRALHDGALTRSFAIATLAITAAGVYAFGTGGHMPRHAHPDPG